MLNHKFFRKVGTLIRDEYRTHVFTKALDVKDKPFKPYTKAYSERKAGGASKNKRFTKGDKFTSPVLSGDLTRDYGTIYKTSPTGFEMVWSSHGAKIEWLKDVGRVLTTKEQALPKAIAKLLEVKTDKFIKEEGLGPDKTTRHRIG